MVLDKGFVYILQNHSHDNLILKIGLTRGQPRVRANQLYWGATGVPEHFDIVVAYSVGNCVEAEAMIHERLGTYRINLNREFFKIDPRVAQMIVLETCVAVNTRLGLSAPIEHRFASKNAKRYLKPIPSVSKEDAYASITSLAGLRDAKMAPLHTSDLSPSQVDRIKIVKSILNEVLEGDLETFIQTFTQDQFPGREIVIWENIAKVYQQFDGAAARTLEEKREGYRFILLSSMLTGDDRKEMISKCSLSFETMMSIVNWMNQ